MREIDSGKIKEILLSTLKEVQINSGHDWSDLSLSSRPIRDLAEFDSLLSVEVTVIIEDKLNLGNITEGRSIFISEDGEQALSIKEIISTLMTLISNKKGSKNE